jgi:hypothetical protein
VSIAVCGPRLGPDPVQPGVCDEPETVGQVHAWERVKARYLRAGLCHYCSSVAAWGHQLGFARVGPPRSSCAMLVLSFPVAKANGWRALPR